MFWKPAECISKSSNPEQARITIRNTVYNSIIRFSLDQCINVRTLVGWVWSGDDISFAPARWGIYGRLWNIGLNFLTCPRGITADPNNYCSISLGMRSPQNSKIICTILHSFPIPVLLHDSQWFSVYNAILTHMNPAVIKISYFP